MTKTILSLLAVLSLLGTQSALADSLRSPAAPGASAYIISPQNGETLTGPVTVVFGLKGMGVAPAGVQTENTGHHHLLINLETLPDMTKPLPATDQVRHFGKGQTEITLELPQGQHRLQLLLGNFAHVPHDPPVLSEPVVITVE